MNAPSGAPPETLQSALQHLQQSGAAELDPVGWHYLETLSRRAEAQQGQVQALLQQKLAQALQAFSAGLARRKGSCGQATLPTTSPLAQLLQEMGARNALDESPQGLRPVERPTENPRVRRFRHQLRKISVQTQVRQAIDKAPQNAGPINSHMLVLRALGLMQDISPDYLARFMNHVETLLRLEDAQRPAPAPGRRRQR